MCLFKFCEIDQIEKTAKWTPASWTDPRSSQKLLLALFLLSHEPAANAMHLTEDGRTNLFKAKELSLVPLP